MNSIGATAATPARTGEATYFFLSYAHSAPMVEDPRLDPDKWVKVFFDDLSAEIRGRIGLTEELPVGFFDGRLPMGADWKAALAEALGAAQVFVPLYSPGYFSNSWPLGELESFRRRLKASPAEQKYRHIAPVLWIPLPSWDQTAETREALELASDVPAYGENGLRALCMLSSYRSQYREILGRIAAEITEVAHRYPLPPSSVPPLDGVSEISRLDAEFVVVVAAPTRADEAAPHDPTVYAERSEHWRPFGAGQALPAASYVASTAERLGLATYVTGFSEVGDVLARRPAVILVDPWIIAGTAGEHDLAAVLKRLPQWAIPLIVTDARDPRNAERGARLAKRVTDMLAASGRPRTMQVRNLQDFVQVMPGLVTEARRQYLKNAPVFPPDQPRTRRPRLGGTELSDGSQARKRTDD
ncbi:TIR-like protein FxsC [Micromonospora sp. NPDC049559]|uniref:TIR-like protein FxsC n=1 Tax=Micromonospora sp. NPDC049559 TaxID=3155923 RepID=UPI00342FCD09